MICRRSNHSDEDKSKIKKQENESRNSVQTLPATGAEDKKKKRKIENRSKESEEKSKTVKVSRFLESLQFSATLALNWSSEFLTGQKLHPTNLFMLTRSFPRLCIID
jgi:hypothetical protein